MTGDSTSPVPVPAEAGEVVSGDWRPGFERARQIRERLAAAEAEIARQQTHIKTLSEEHHRHDLAVQAHQARADQQESRAVRAEKQLARFADQAVRYDELAEQAAQGQRDSDVLVEVRRRMKYLDRAHERAEAAEAEVARLQGEMGYAMGAAAGSHEGIRLWMISCGELVAKHLARAEAAEAELAGIAALCRDPGTAVGYRMGGKHVPGDLVAASILAIIGSEREADRG